MYLRGISKRTSDDELKQILSAHGSLVSYKRIPGQCWVGFGSEEEADAAVEAMHRTPLNGCVLSVRHMREDGTVVKSYNTVSPDLYSEARVDRIPYSRHVDVMDRGIVVDGKEYPIPQAEYLVRLLRLCHARADSRLLDLLTRKREQQAKEVSEAMATVEAVKRLTAKHNIDKCDVYVLGDGKEPIASAALAMHFPWNYRSIDPIAACESIRDIPCGEGTAQIEIVRAMSQDVEVDSTAGFSLVIACHSHAPLQEFYDRVPRPKACVAIPCCSKYCEMRETPLYEYEDFEIYSPRRKVFIYLDL